MYDVCDVCDVFCDVMCEYMCVYYFFDVLLCVVDV